jgi:hypothetical protein
MQALVSRVCMEVEELRATVFNILGSMRGGERETDTNSQNKEPALENWTHQTLAPLVDFCPSAALTETVDRLQVRAYGSTYIYSCMHPRALCFRSF